jgi:flavin-binding protein dodecin
VANPFDGSGKPEGGGRLLGRRKKAEAAAAIEALLANAARITDVSQADVAAACSQCGVDSSKQVRKEFKTLYGRYLDFCFEDRKLSAEESVDLEHLKQILQLGDADVSGIQDDVAISVYGSAVAEVLEDLRIDPEEADFLKRLREELKLPESKAERILEDSARDARGRALQEATSSDNTFVKRREPAGEFTGRSKQGLESAVDNALGKAGLAIPQLHWFEVTQLSGYVEDGSTSQWYVVLQAGIRQDD